MGQIEVYEKENIEDEPHQCTYCQEKLTKYVEFYPHEAGGYCIFAPRNDIDYACESCAFKECEVCNKKLPKYMYINCSKCNKVHCFNNTDMKYEGNPMLSEFDLCDARNCDKII